MQHETVRPATQGRSALARGGQRPGRVLPALYVGLVAVHLVLGWPMRQPHIFPDEMAYLSHARYLAGGGALPDMGETNFYHPGYSLFLVPAFLMFSEPAAAYRASVATNALLISTLLFALYRVLHVGLGVSSRRAAAVAITTCLYPAFLLQPTLAWAENALIPGYSWLIAAFAMLSRRPTMKGAFWVGTAASSLYLVHPRALPLLFVVAVALCALPLTVSARWRTTAVGLATIAALFAATELVNAHLRSSGWSQGPTMQTVAEFLGRAGSAPRLVGAALATAGQSLYLAQATLGVFLVPLVWFGFELWRTGLRAAQAYADRSTLVTMSLVAASSAALAFGSAVAVASGGSRADHLMYGRYNEMFLPIWMAWGLLLLSGGSLVHQKRRWMSVLAVLGALALLVAAARGDELRTREYVAPNIFGIYPVVRAMGHVDVLAISLISGALFLILAASFRRGAALGLTVTAGVFTAGALYGYGYCTAAQASIASRDDVPARLRAMGDVRAVSFDITQPITQRMDFGEDRAERYFSTQFLLPRTRLHRFNSERGEKPPVPLVISTRTWKDARALGARYVTSERGAETALWVLPASRHYFAAAEPYVDTSLGWRWFPGVWESGFHATERDRAGRFRWTDGRATLVVPVNEFPARLITHLAPSRPDANVRVIVNGVELWNGPYPAGRRSLDLAECPVSEWVTIQLASDAIVPRDYTPESRDGRTLGVAVREVRLATR